MAGQTAAEARGAAAANPDGYNIRVGVLRGSIGAGVELEANDNVLLEAANREFDLIIRPQLNTRVAWPISDKNSLNLQLGVGYSAYTLHSEFNRLFIVPGTELSFDLYAGDFLLEAHDRLFVAKDAYADPSAVGGANYSRLQNSAGLSITGDLNKLVPRLGYDHSTYGEFTGNGAYLTGNSDLMDLSVGYRWRPSTIFGIQAGGGWVRYDDDTTPYGAATEFNVGTFVEAQVSEHVVLKAAAGFNTYIPNTSGTATGGNDFSGAYARLTLNHLLNRYVEYSLSGGRSLSFGFYAGTMDLGTANLDLRFHIFQKLGVWAGFSFENGDQVGTGSETFLRFGPRIGLERSITAKLSGTLMYQFYQRTSDVPDTDYAINLVTFNISYRL